MLELLKTLLLDMGFQPQNAETLALVVELGLLGLLAFASSYLFRFLGIKVIRSLVRHSRTNLDDLLLNDRFLNTLGWLITPVILLAGLDSLFPQKSEGLLLGIRIIQVLLILLGARLLDVFLDNVSHIFQNDPRKKALSLAGYVQVIRVLVYLIAFIFAASTLLEKDPWGIVTGIGALTAILVLVFKDSLLGLTASVQISGNNLVNLGDWIEVPSYNADGIVIDMTITQVKVRNWNNSISSIPTYALVSGAFRNWRGVEEAGTRRIKRALLLDINSIRFISIPEVELSLRTLGLEPPPEWEGREETQKVSASRLLRDYAEVWLKKHPKISKDQPVVVRQLDPREKGLPLQIYCFSTVTEWQEFEKVQAEIFDHLLAILPLFGLKAPS